MADLFTTAPYETWREKGTNLMDRAGARLEEILGRHEVTPIPPDQAREIEARLPSLSIDTPGS